jgi:NTE family protein
VQRFCAYRFWKCEEAGLKIDYIEEQVWGQLLGLYASGYTATQIDSIFSLKFWWIDKWFHSKVFKKLYEKEWWMLVLPFNNFNGIPEALSKGMYNFNLLSEYKHVRDFNNFHSFLCIATDIGKGFC